MTMIIKGGKRYCSSSNLAEDIIYNNENSSLEATDVQNAIDEMQNNLGGFSFFKNPNVIFLTSENMPYEVEDEIYILADSPQGQEMLVDSTYTIGSVEGSFYKTKGADTVFPFKGKVDLARLTPATAVAEQITAGYTAWVNGELITGTRPTPVQTLSGSIQVSCYLNESKSNQINFAQEFDTVPTIKVTKGSEWGAASGGSSKNISYDGVTSVTTKGFIIKYHSSGNSGANGSTRYCTFNWVATAT